MEVRFEITDVTKTSLIGPRFMMTAFFPGYTNVTFHPSQKAAEEYRANYFGRQQA